MALRRFDQLTGARAQAMALVQDQRKPDQDVTGHIPCPRCRSPLRFTVMCNGMSRGQCAAGGCVRWLQ